MRHARFKPFALVAAAVLALSACTGGTGSGSDAPEGSGGGGDGGTGYPDGTITVIVPFAAGGPTDTVTRLASEPMAAAPGHNIVDQTVDGVSSTVAANPMPTP